MALTQSWTEIYNYYIHNGLLAFIVNNVSNFVIGFIISLAPIFLFGCCNWSKISEATCITEFIVSLPEGWHNSNLFIKICTLMFLLFVLFNMVQFLFALPTFISLHSYFKNVLEIKDYELYIIDWNDIIERIAQKDKSRPISVLEIAQEIMRFDNYITAFVTDETILTWKLPYMDEPCHFPMTQFFTYLFKLSLNGIVLDAEGVSLVSGAQTIRNPQAQSSLNTRFKLIGIIMFIVSPFVFCFVVLYLVFNYFEAIKNRPSSLSHRSWSTHAKWAIKEYNELPHVFDLRLSKSYYFANRFLDMFPPTAAQPIFKLVTFLSGSLIVIILVIGLATDISALVAVKIGGGKSLAWLCTILASLYSVCNNMVRDESTIQDPESLYENVKKYIHYAFTDETNSARSWKTYKRFSDFFQPIWEQVALELGSCIINPILFLFVLPKKANMIVEFVRKNSVQHPRLNWICSFSSFDEGSLEQNDLQNGKIKRSISNFKLFAKHGSQPELIGFDDDMFIETPLVTRVPSTSYISEANNHTDNV
jgi:autophagy-related protein 9